MFQILGPIPLLPSTCIQNKSFATSGVSFLLTLTDTWMNGQQVLRNLLMTTRVRPDLVQVLIDRNNKSANVSEWVQGVGPQILKTMAENLYALHKTVIKIEVIDPHSCFGRQLTRVAFNDTTQQLFKTTYAYMWGMFRLSSQSKFVAHIDNDYTVVYPNVGLDWVSTALELLRYHNKLLSVHPSSSDGFGYARRQADCYENHSVCTCVDIRTCTLLRDGTSLNSFKEVVPLKVNGTTLCGHTVNALNRGGRHFSFQAWVTKPAHFVNMWPLRQPALHIERIFDHLNVKHELVPLWLPVSIGGWKVKLNRKSKPRKLATALRGMKICRSTLTNRT